MKVLPCCRVVCWFLFLWLAKPALSFAADTVAFAGLAYAGDASQIDARFPVTRRVAQDLTAAGNAPGVILMRALKSQPPANFSVSYDGMSSLKSSDQALATALVMTDETVSSERFGQIYKVMVSLRAQGLIFDFKAMKVIRAYPVSLTLLDVLDHEPSENDLRERVARLLVGSADKPGLFGRYALVLANASIPASGARYLQINQVNLAQSVVDELPESLKAQGAAQSWVADMFGQALLDRAGTPILPFTKGYAIGNAMAMRFADGEVFNLKLPEADYTIHLDLTGLKRVTYGSSAAGTSYIYAVYSHVGLNEPMSGKQYLDATFKNGEVKAVPVTQSDIDDFPAYSDSLRGLFVKLSDVLGGKDDEWLKSAVSGEQVDKQIDIAREVVKSCR